MFVLVSLCFTEVTGERPSDQHIKSILSGFVDKETSMHCGSQFSSGDTYENLKNKVLQFVNPMLARSQTTPMDISKVGEFPADPRVGGEQDAWVNKDHLNNDDPDDKIGKVKCNHRGDWGPSVG